MNTNPPSTSPSSAPSSPRPRIAFVVNTLTPYRVTSHTRVKREIPQFDVDTYIVWDPAKNPWVYKDAIPEIGVVFFDGAAAEKDIGTFRYYRRDWATGGEVVKRLEATKPVAVIACGYGYPSLMRVILWCRRTGTPCMLWSDSNVHSDNASGFRRKIKDRLVGFIVRTCRAILICGSNGIRYYSNYGCPESKIFPFPVEPDYNELDRVGPDLINQAADRFQIAKGRRRICVCARLVPVKAVDQAIDTFVSIADERPDWDLIIVGNGPLRSLLESRVPSRLAHRVQFVGFVDQQPLVSALYKQSDILLHPATWEPWGVVLLEAAAAGLAIITTNVVGAAAELCKDGVNGAIINPDDRVSLRKALLNVTDATRIDDMKAASLRVSSQFRTDFDPVAGMRKALAYTGLLNDGNTAA